MLMTNLNRELSVNDAHYGEVLTIAYTSFVVPKGSPLLEAIGQPIRWLKDTGIKCPHPKSSYVIIRWN